MGKKLYCGNLSFNVTSSDLDQLFGQFGTVQSAEVINDRDTGRSRGFGFVTFADPAACRKAIETMAKKMASDVASYARTLAAQRKRNVELVEQAVTESKSFTETEALNASPPLIDLVAADVPELEESYHELWSTDATEAGNGLLAPRVSGLVLVRLAAAREGLGEQELAIGVQRLHLEQGDQPRPVRRARPLP